MKILEPKKLEMVNKDRAVEALRKISYAQDLQKKEGEKYRLLKEKIKAQVENEKNAYIKIISEKQKQLNSLSIECQRLEERKRIALQPLLEEMQELEEKKRELEERKLELKTLEESLEKRTEVAKGLEQKFKYERLKAKEELLKLNQKETQAQFLIKNSERREMEADFKIKQADQYYKKKSDFIKNRLVNIRKRELILEGNENQLKVRISEYNKRRKALRDKEAILNNAFAEAYKKKII
jgi:hypothetical protein